MLEVGNFGSTSHCDLDVRSPEWYGTEEGASAVIESRTHFGAWCITSSPLILSFDLTNIALLKDVWSIIANKQALAVNQAWDGDAGRLLYSWDPVDEITKDLPYYVWVLPCDDFDEEQQGWALKVQDEGTELRWRVDGVDVPIWEVKHTRNLLRFPINGSKLNNSYVGKKCLVVVVGVNGIIMRAAIYILAQIYI